MANAYAPTRDLVVAIRSEGVDHPLDMVSDASQARTAGTTTETRLPTGVVLTDVVAGTPGTLNLSIIPGALVRAENVLNAAARGEGNITIIVTRGDYREVEVGAADKLIAWADDGGGPGGQASGTTIITSSGAGALNLQSGNVKAGQKIIQGAVAYSLDKVLGAATGWASYFGMVAGNYATEQTDQAMRDIDAIAASNSWRLVEHAIEYIFDGQVSQGAGFTVGTGTPSDSIIIPLNSDPSVRLIVNDA